MKFLVFHNLWMQAQTALFLNTKIYQYLENVLLSPSSFFVVPFSSFLVPFSFFSFFLPFTCFFFIIFLFLFFYPSSFSFFLLSLSFNMFSNLNDTTYFVLYLMCKNWPVFDFFAIHIFRRSEGNSSPKANSVHLVTEADGRMELFEVQLNTHGSAWLCAI